VSRRVGSWLRRRPDPGQQTRAPDKQAARQTLVVVVYLAAALGSAFAQHAAGAVAAVIPLVLLATACAGTAARVRITSRRR
jgi:hypothetical protein